MAKTPKGVVAYKAGDVVAPGTKVQYSNGTMAVVQPDGRHKFVKYTLTAAQKRARSALLARGRATPRGAKPMSPKAAARAFNKFYKERSYKSPKARQAAITRDLCHKKATVVTNESYKRSPLSKDYKGLDDGARCPGTVKATKPNPKALAALAAYRAKKTA